MAPRAVYPKSNAECVSLLLTLGFVKKKGTGRGKHPEKYFHPDRNRNNTVQGDKPFVLIAHEYFDEKAVKMMKKLQNWGYTKAEIEAALLYGAKPSQQQVSADTDIEAEGA